MKRFSNRVWSRWLYYTPFFAICFFSCADQLDPDDSEIKIKSHEFSEILLPTDEECSTPDYFLNDQNEVCLSWVEWDSVSTTSTLYFSKLQNEVWGKKQKVASGDNWFLNWADFPTVCSYGETQLAASFLVEHENDPYAYDIYISLSDDAGQSWDQPFKPYDDSSATEHGFVSLVPWRGNLMCIWLDGREYENGRNETSLRAAQLSSDGKVLESYILDDRVCDCCPTDAVANDEAIAVVYRNRTEDEIRDISIVTFSDEGWSQPKPVNNENWEIAGCPVNGPAIDLDGNIIAVAWFTNANDQSQVKMSFSDDFGNSFDPPMTIDDSSCLGRVDVCLLNENEGYVSWIDHVEGKGEIKLKKVFRGSNSLNDKLISEISTERASGFPKIIQHKNNVHISWTSVKDISRVRSMIGKLVN